MIVFGSPRERFLQEEVGVDVKSEKRMKKNRAKLKKSRTKRK